jgi:hypothetical protein
MYVSINKIHQTASKRLHVLKDSILSYSGDVIWSDEVKDFDKKGFCQNN